MTVETTGLWTSLTEAAFQEGTRRSVGRNHPHVARQDFIEGVQWALEQGIVQEMLEVLERLAPETNILGGLAADARAVLARIRGEETTDDE